jgi:hypothetical protein
MDSTAPGQLQTVLSVDPRMHAQHELRQERCNHEDIEAEAGAPLHERARSRKGAHDGGGDNNGTGALEEHAEARPTAGSGNASQHSRHIPRARRR